MRTELSFSSTSVLDSAPLSYPHPESICLNLHTSDSWLILYNHWAGYNQDQRGRGTWRIPRGLVLETLFLRSSIFISATFGTSRGRRETWGFANTFLGLLRPKPLTLPPPPWQQNTQPKAVLGAEENLMGEWVCRWNMYCLGSDTEVPSYSTFMMVMILNAPRGERGLGLAIIIICVIKVYLSTKYFLCL